KAFMAQQWQGFLRNRSNRKEDAIWGPYFEFNKLSEKEFAAKTKEVNAQVLANKKLNPLVAKAFATPPPNFKAGTERYGRLLNEADKQWQAALTTYEKKKSAGKDDDLKEPKNLPDPAIEAFRKEFYNTELNVSYDRLAGLNNNAIRNQENPILTKI